MFISTVFTGCQVDTTGLTDIKGVNDAGLQKADVGGGGISGDAFNPDSQYADAMPDIVSTPDGGTGGMGGNQTPNDAAMADAISPDVVTDVGADAWTPCPAIPSTCQVALNPDPSTVCVSPTTGPFNQYFQCNNGTHICCIINPIPGGCEWSKCELLQ